MDNEYRENVMDVNPAEANESSEANVYNKIDNGEKHAKIGRKLFIIAIIILAVMVLVTVLLSLYIEANNIRTDDSNGIGWAIGFLLWLPGIYGSGAVFTVGSIFAIVSEMKYKKYLQNNTLDVISKKRKNLHIFSIIHIAFFVIALILLFVVWPVITYVSSN